jgi:hypothetical protein
VCYPATDFETFNQFCTRIWPNHEINFASIFRNCNQERPILRGHFIKGLVLIVDKIRESQEDEEIVDFFTLLRTVVDKDLVPFSETLNWQAIRDEFFYQDDCKTMLSEFVHTSRRVFNNYNHIVQMRSVFTIESALSLITDARCVKVPETTETFTVTMF